MSHFFSDNFKAALAVNQALMDGLPIKVVLFRYAPGMGSIKPEWAAAKTVPELVATSPGWVVSTAMTNTLAVSTTTSTDLKSRYVIIGAAGYPFATLTQTTETRALAVVGTVNGVPDSIIFVTNTPIDGSVTNIAKGDALTAREGRQRRRQPLAVLLGSAVGGRDGNRQQQPVDQVSQRSETCTESPALSTGGRYLGPNPNDNLSKWTDMGVAQLNIVEGPLVFMRGSPPFEVAGSQHVWLYPQRANMIANPSFEAVGTNFWSSNGPLTRVSGAAPGSGPTHAWAGSCSVPQVGYLTPTVGTVSTPDPGPLPNQCCLVFNVQGPTGLGQIAAQWEVSGQLSWEVSREMDQAVNPLVRLETSPNGTGSAGPKRSLNLPVASPEHLALAIDQTLSSLTLSKYDAANGTWSIAEPKLFLPFSTFDSNSVLRIGKATFGSDTTFAGRIYSVELRSGLDPAAGTVLWRFDANDYPGSGTSYTDPRGRTWTLSVAGAITAKTGSAPYGRSVMESNVFATQLGEHDSEYWTIQLMAKGTGTLKVGLVYWDLDYRITGVDWGERPPREKENQTRTYFEEWVLSPSGWMHIATHRHAPEGHLAMVRLECSGDLTIDRVLCERDHLKDWAYFDGDDTFGARDDFSWYGGMTDYQGASYSLWYNHRKAVTGRLFARTVDPNDPTQNVTDEDMEEQGLAYRWVPAGTTVVPHLDVFYPFDPRNPLPPKPAGVMPYYTVSDPDGVGDPWA